MEALFWIAVVAWAIHRSNRKPLTDWQRAKREYERVNRYGEYRVPDTSSTRWQSRSRK